jgi:isocitrate dehydrogenase (NAD+)
VAKHRVTLIAGDGIGPEITSAVVKILETAGLDVDWEPHLAGAAALEKQGSPLPTELLDSIVRNRVALKGPLTTPVGGGFASVNVGLRKGLELFVNLRPVWNIPGVPSRYQGVDLVIVRENTEDLYSGLEHEVVPGVVESLKIITSDASTRIAEFAFEYARRHGRTRITAVHKANIMKMGDGLFLKCVQEVAANYPDIAQDDRIVDAACMHLVMRPEQFDMLLLPNLYGDIVSDLCAGLVGGLGVVPAANLGVDIGVFEAVHGSAPDIAGRNIANPMALLLITLALMAVLGPRPRHLAVRFALITAMLAVALYSGAVVLRNADGIRREVGGLPSRLPEGDARRVRFDELHTLSTRLMMVNLVGALTLLFWEARE